MAKPDILSAKIMQLLEKQHMLSAQQILQHLEQAGTPYNKTSVYRSLDKLLNQGSICKYDFSQGEASYELQDDHHDHVVCTSCGKVETVPCRFDKTTRIPGFSIDHHHLTFFGTCLACK